MTVLVFRWVYPGQRPPDGFVATEAVSRWPDTLEIRARLYVREEPS